jgi:hypothetical protein
LIGTVNLKEPFACTERERLEFERLVRQGFDGSDDGLPGRIRDGIAENLCQLLLARVPESCVFATTRPDNNPMIRVLLALGFARVGKPYPHQRRNEELVLFLRQ